MEELIQYMVAALVDNKDAVQIRKEGSVIKITVDKPDMGKIIGKQGRIAKAIKTIVRCVAQKTGEKASVEIVDAQVV